ncbi:MAG: hypothetical protein LBK67_06520 [Coriobacteriales bacterium]|nr:hypothetical protein [Coriobacteriales bacterium]
MPILYADAPETIEGLMPATTRSAQVVFVIPTTDNVRRDTCSVGSTEMVSREWGFLDALASPGRQPDAALEILANSKRGDA